MYCQLADAKVEAALADIKLNLPTLETQGLSFVVNAVNKKQVIAFNVNPTGKIVFL